MLVLSRKRGEKITLIVPPSDVEQRIEVTALEIGVEGHRKCRLGFEMPIEIEAVRNEIMEPRSA